MTTKGTRRLSGVNVHDYKQLMTKIHDASDKSREPNIAPGQLYGCLQTAIESAKRDDNGFGSCSTGDTLATATLDADAKNLLAAEFYICHAEYRDEEAFKK
jgi:hypothetical protein